MAKKICTPPKDYSEHIARTKKTVDKWLKGLDPETQAMAAKSLYEKLYDQDPEKAEIFREVVAQNYPDYIVFPAFTKGELDLSLAPVSVQQLDPTPFVDEVMELEDQLYAGLSQEQKDNIPRDDSTKGKFAEIQIGNAGFGVFKPILMSALGTRLTSEEYAHIVDNIRKKAKTFEAFESALKAKYESYTGTKSQVRSLEGIYLATDPLNKMRADDKTTLMWTNLNPMEPNIYKAILPENNKEFQHLRDIDLKTGTKEPEWVSTNFIDVNEILVHGQSINDMTIYVPVSKMVEVIDKYRKKEGPPPGDPGWFAKDANIEISEYLFNYWNYRLGNLKKGKESVPHVIAGINSGDPSTLLVTAISDDIFKKLLPRDTVKELAIKGAFQTERAANYLKQRGYSIFHAVRDARLELPKHNVSDASPIKGKKTVAAQLMRARYDRMLEVAGKLAEQGYTEYFYEEVDAGNITEKELAIFLDNIKAIPRAAGTGKVVLTGTGKPMIPMHIYLAGIIAKHEWMKANRYNTYAIHDDARKTYDRLRLSKAPGLVEIGKGPKKHFIYDQDRVDIYYEGNKVDHIIRIPGLGLVNINDGATWVSTEDLNRTQEVTGRYPIHAFESNVRQVKTVVVDRTNDGKDYLEKKHALLQVRPGIEIRDQRTGETILWTAKEMGLVRMFAKDADGNVVLIKEASDLDAVKTAVGKWNIKEKKLSHFVDDIEQNSHRTIILPPTVAHTTSAGPRQWMSNLYIDGLNKEQQGDLNKFKAVFEDYMLSEADKHIDLLLDVYEHPSFMRKLLNRKWAQELDVPDTLKDLLRETNGAGILHPTYQSQIRPMLQNMIVKRGALQFRTFEDKITGERQPIVGSDGIIAQDTGRELGDNHDQFMASADIQVLRDYAERLLFAHDAKAILKNIEKHDLEGLPPSEFAIKQAKKDYMSLSEEDRVDALNYALEAGIIRVRAMSWRTPILSLAALGVYDLKKFTVDDGQALYFTPQDVAKRKVGDRDIDHANILVIPDSLADKFQEYMDTEYFKAQLEVTANLDLFKEMPSASMADYNGSAADAVTQIKGSNTQGIMANMKAVSAILAYKFEDITLTDGTVVRAKKPTDTMIMDYAPLKQDRSIKEIEADLPPFASVKEAENGEWYIEATVEFEHTILANAATDHSKKGKLVNMFGYTGPDWVLSKMFKVVKGSKELNPSHIETLSNLKKMFKYNRLMAGEMYDGRPMDMETFIFRANELLEFMESEPEVRLEKIKDIVNRDKTVGKVTENVGIESMVMKDNITSAEKLIVRTVEKMRERYGEEMPKYPGWIDPDEHTIIHYSAVQSLERDIIEHPVEYGINEEVISEAEKFITKFASEYYDMFYALKNENGEYEGAASIAKAKFDEDMWQFVKQAENSLNLLKEKHGDGVAVWATLLFAQGIGTLQKGTFTQRKNIRHFPPGEVMDIPTYKKYMNLWETYRGDEAVRKNFEQLEEIGRRKWNTARIIEKKIKKDKDC